MYKNIHEKRTHKINVIRYADDFIITGDSKEWLEDVVKPRVIQFLNTRGLRLSEEKTHITPIQKGFDFLGWHIRKYPNGQLLIKPSDNSIKAVLEKTGDIMRNNRQAKTANLINMLNPVIRGWANYHQHAIAKRIFQKIDYLIFQQLWYWAKRRHPKKALTWIKAQYFKTVGHNHWVFTGIDGFQPKAGQSVLRVLRLELRRPRPMRLPDQHHSLEHTCCPALGWKPVLTIKDIRYTCLKQGLCL